MVKVVAAKSWTFSRTVVLGYDSKIRSLRNIDEDNGHLPTRGEVYVTDDGAEETDLDLGATGVYCLNKYS